MGQKSGTAGDKLRYARYKAEGRYEKNKRKRVERHLKRNPGDEVAKEALKGTFKFSKKAPNARSHFYSRSVKRFANVLRILRGNAKDLDHFLRLERVVYV